MKSSFMSRATCAIARLRLVATGLTCAIVCSHAPAALAESFECIIEPHVEVEISSAVPGIVEAVEVERGDEIKKGQVLVRLVSGVELAAHDLAKARAEFARRKNERNADLVEERLISSNEKDQIETEALLAQLELRESTERLALRTIRSPIDGVVAEVDVSPGEYVSDGEIMQLAQLHPLNVEVVVPVSAHGRIARGMQATVRPEFPFEGDRTATVIIVDRVVDAASGTLGVRLELPNPKRELPGGLKCVVEFAGADPPA
jgi:RND family efflux transporter MFP subunit